jgi:hypothetical protein
MSEANDLHDDLFNATKSWPAHMSASAVLFNHAHEIAMHYWERAPWGNNVYSLMHETLHNLEPLEVAVARGLQEEWGAEGKIIAYLGTQVLSFYEAKDKLNFHKALPYFLVEFESMSPERRDNEGYEAQSRIVWKPIPEALEIMSDQAKRFPDRPDLDETVALNWAQEYLKI